MVGFFWGEARTDHGDLHGLFLKQWHAQCAFGDLFQLRAKGLGFLQAMAAADIGLNHIALNGAGAYNCHLDHQIVKLLRPHPGQKIHLRPAFHLKHPH